MSTAVWPPIESEQLLKEEQASQARELEWLLIELQETLQSLKAGLEECAALLAPTEHGSTLVLSSLRSEALKGLVTRVGTRVVKGNIRLRLPGLPPPRGQSSYDLTISSAPQAPTLVVEQLTSVRTLINTCLDIVDVTTWTGDAKNANFIAGQLRLLYDNLQEARQALKGGSDVRSPWWENPVDDNIFDPPLPANLAFHLSVLDAALLVEVRTLEVHDPADDRSAFSFRNQLAVALRGPKQPAHDEADRSFKFKGKDVRVKEKIRVESQDPALISAMAKLNALEHNVSLSRKALDIVMDREE